MTDTNFDTLFANANANKRAPTVGELDGGFECGPADLDLFNGLHNKYYLSFGDLYDKTENFIEQYETVDRADKTQLPTAIDKATKAIFYTDTGTANTVLLSRPGTAAVSEKLFDGFTFFFKPNVANTGATTIKVGTLAAKSARFRGAALASGYLDVNHVYIATYDQTADVFNIGNTTIESQDFTLPDDVTFNSVTANLVNSVVYDGERIDLDISNETTDTSRYAADFRQAGTNTDNITASRTKVTGVFQTDLYTPDNGDKDISSQLFYVDGSRSYAHIRGGTGDFREAYGSRSYATTYQGFSGEGTILTGSLAIATCDNNTQIDIVRGQVTDCVLNAGSTHNDVIGSQIRVNPNDGATGSSADVYGIYTDMNDDSGGNFNVTARTACLYQIYSGTWNTAGDKYGIYQNSGIENNRFIGGIDLDSGGIRLSGGSTMSNYEEVSFIPTFNGAPTATTRTGRAIRIGNKVDGYMRIEGTSAQRAGLSSSTLLQFGNIPWISELATERNGAVHVIERDGVYGYAQGTESISGLISAANDVIYLWDRFETQRTLKTYGDWAAGDFYFDIHFSMILN